MYSEYRSSRCKTNIPDEWANRFLLVLAAYGGWIIYIITQKLHVVCVHLPHSAILCCPLYGATFAPIEDVVCSRSLSLLSQPLSCLVDRVYHNIHTLLSLYQWYRAPLCYNLTTNFRRTSGSVFARAHRRITVNIPFSLLLSSNVVI